MAERSAIEWTDATFKPWIGCTRVSPACDHCYAAALMETRRHVAEWGAGKPRVRTKPGNWRKPLQWNAATFVQCDGCGARGDLKDLERGDGCCEIKAWHPTRRRVFCASLSDLLDNEVPVEWLVDLLDLIRNTPQLDWLLLTKRIGNWRSRLDQALLASERRPADEELSYWIGYWLSGAVIPRNVWLGATVVNQAEADRDVPKLLKVPARVRFLSMEPLLGAVNIEKWLDPWTCSSCGYHGSEGDTGPTMCADCGLAAVYDESIGSARCPSCGRDDGTSDDVGGTCPECGSVDGWSRDCGHLFDVDKPHLLDWIIVGGESGPGARPMHPDWVRSLRDQCAAAGVPFLFKQWGEFRPPLSDEEWDKAERARQTYGGALASDGRFENRGAGMLRVGKKAAGRLLDGREWNGFP